MDLEDQYRKKAKEARKWATRAKNDEDKAKWLRLVQGWLSLIRVRPQSDEERFDGEVTKHDTGQERSERNH